MKDIKTWIKENIIVDRFPVSGEIKPNGKHADVQIIINVSDEFYLGNSQEIMKLGKQNYYFPMGEQGESMGLTSLFGALQVIHSVFENNPEYKILLHCQAGKNRSPTVKSAFYFMMTSEHEPDQLNENNVLIRNNRLLDNCERNHLPNLQTTEKFLLICKYAFENTHNFLGGMLDWVMSKSEINERESDENKKINFT